jgi:hypothetical protein
MQACFRAGIAFVSVCLTGCTIHPLPDDVTGISTYDIVRQIRCEARQAIFDEAVGWLAGPKDPDPEAQKIGSEFQSGSRPIDTFNYTLFRGGVRQVVQLFYNTGIAYNFQLDMTETDNIDPTLDFLKMFEKNQFTVNVTANADRMRENIRTFTVTDTFSGLLRNSPPHYCDGFIVQANYIYPVVGKIGMDRMINDFVNLTLFGGLAAPSSNGSIPSPKGPPTMVDQLKFTTKFNLTTTPKVVFSPVRNLMDASVGITATRQDIHTVTIGLAIDTGSVAQVAAFRATLLSTGPLGPLLSAAPANNAEFLATQAVNQVLTQQLFKPTVTVTATP